MTKEYKLGDTIYVKGTVGQIDGDDHEKPYGIKFVDWDYGTPAWPNRSDIIDELPTAEPVKPVLPKEVGEELDIAKSELPFDVYIGNIFGGVSSAKASYHYYFDNANAIIKLADAWRYGYTVEKTKLYNLILNDDFNGKIICLFKLTLVDELWAAYNIGDTSLKHNEEYQFTQEEIDKYNKNFWIKNIDLNDYKVEVRTDD